MWSVAKDQGGLGMLVVSRFFSSYYFFFQNIFSYHLEDEDGHVGVS